MLGKPYHFSDTMKRNRACGDKFRSAYETAIVGLQEMTREQRLTLIEEANRLCVEERALIMTMIPEELWSVILLQCDRMESLRLFCLGVVCKQWLRLSDALIVLHYASKCTEPLILRKFTHLDTLSLYYAHAIQNNDLMRMTNLTRLDLRDNYTITWVALAPLTALRSLDIGKNPNISEKALLLMATRLETLGLRKNHMINDDCLTQLTCLTSLNLDQNDRISDQALTTLSRLRALNLERNDKITDAALLRLPALTRLDLSHWWAPGHITDKGIRQLTGLQWLSVSRDCGVTPQTLLTLTLLRGLDLHSSNLVTGAWLRQMTQLESLSIGFNIVISDDDMRCMGSLTALSLNNKSITDAGVKHLTNLKKLALTSCCRVTADVTNHLNIQVSGPFAEPVDTETI